MNRRLSHWGLLLGVALPLLASIGCGDHGAGPDPRWTSTHFWYYAEPDDPAPCASVTDLLERHFAVMQAYLGFDWPAGQMIQYNKFRDGTAFRASATCQTGTVACLSEGRVESTIAFDQHELIHAYLAPSGRPPALFEEGVAMALSWQIMTCNALTNPAPPALSWADAILLGDPNTNGGIYLSGARLVGHLLRRYDPSLFVRLYRALPRTTTPEIVSNQMMELYGKSGDELWAEAISDPGCVTVWPCARDPLPLDGNEAHLAASCAGIDHDQRTVDLSTQSNVLLSTNADPQLSLLACDPDAPAPPSFLFPTSNAPLLTGLINLGPGKYFLDFYNYPTDIALSIPDGPPAGPDCAALQPLPLPANQLAIHVASPVASPVYSPVSSNDWFVAFHIGSPARTLAISNGATTDLMLCPSCDFSLSNCTALPKATPFIDLVLEQDVYVRLRGTELEVTDP